MRINQLPTERPVNVVTENIHRLPVVLLKYVAGDMYTWRGVGQKLPNHVWVVGIINIVFVDDGHSSCFPLGVEPSWVEIDFNSGDQFMKRIVWSEMFFDQHDVDWSMNMEGGVASAKYVHKKEDDGGVDLALRFIADVPTD